MTKSRIFALKCVAGDLYGPLSTSKSFAYECLEHKEVQHRRSALLALSFFHNCQDWPELVASCLNIARYDVDVAARCYAVDLLGRIFSGKKDCTPLSSLIEPFEAIETGQPLKNAIYWAVRSVLYGHQKADSISALQASVNQGLGSTNESVAKTVNVISIKLKQYPANTSVDNELVVEMLRGGKGDTTDS